MRVIDYISIAATDIRRQRVRSTLTIFALVISTVILVLMAAISIGGRQAISDQFGSDAHLTSISVTPNQSTSSLNPFGDVQEVNASTTKMDDSTVATLMNIAHVRSATAQAHVWEIAQMSLDDGAKQLVAQAEGIPGDAQLGLSVGRMFASNDESNVAIIGSSYAKALGYESNPELLVGKTLQLTTQKGYRGVDADIPGPAATKSELEAFNETRTVLPVTVVGVTDAGPDQNNLFIPIGWAHKVRTIFYYESGARKENDQIAASGYTTIELNVDDVSNVKNVSTAIQDLGYGQLSTLSQIERLQQLSSMMWLILGAVSIIAVVAAALGVVNTMLMAVSEQRYVIGVWRACGARKSTILHLFLIQSGLLGFVGGVVGVVFGVLASGFVNEYVNSLLQAQGLSIANIAIVPPWLMGGTILLTTLFGLIAGIYPAYRAARQDPAQALAE